MSRRNKGHVEDPDEAKAAATRAANRSEQERGMKERGEVDRSKQVKVFEDEAREFANAPEADGYAPYQFLPRHAFEKMAREQGKPVSKEQVLAHYGVDETMPEGAVCWLCDTIVVPRRWAIANKGGFVVDRDSTDGALLFVAATTKRYDKDNRPFVAVACGSLFDPDSHLTLTREVKRTGPDGTPVYFRDERGEVRPLRLNLYAKVRAEVDAELGKLSGTQATIARLGGLVNRPRTGPGYRFDPRTPRGQRRDGGTTSHDRGR